MSLLVQLNKKTKLLGKMEKSLNSENLLFSSETLRETIVNYEKAS